MTDDATDTIPDDPGPVIVPPQVPDDTTPAPDNAQEDTP